jgi:hypothetical protein
MHNMCYVAMYIQVMHWQAGVAQLAKQYGVDTVEAKGSCSNIDHVDIQYTSHYYSAAYGHSGG